MASNEALAQARADCKSESFRPFAALLDKARALVLARPSDLDPDQFAKRKRLECPMCLESISPFYNGVVVSLMPCCGGFICLGCSRKQSIGIATEGMKSPDTRKCHICAASLPATPKEVERMLLTRAAKGISYAQHILGSYHCGMAIAASTLVVAKPSPALGLDLLKRAAENNYPPSCCMLARMHAEGHMGCEIKKDLREAHRLLQLHIVSDATRGPFYYFQMGCLGLTCGCRMSISYLDQAAKAGHLQASFKLAQMYLREGDEYMRIKYLKLAAEQGHIEAIGMIGCIYLSSSRSSRDCIKESFRLVAENGADAGIRGRYCYYLAMLFDEDGDDPNLIEWLGQASDQGYGEAAYRLSAFYLSGSHVEANNSRAAFFLRRAAVLSTHGQGYDLAWLNRSGARYLDTKDFDVGKLVCPYPQAEDGVQLFIKNLSGRSVTIFVRLSDRVATIKERVRDVEGVPPRQQRLIFSGKQLEDDQVISECNIQREATIHLALRLVSIGRLHCVLPDGSSISFQANVSGTVAVAKKTLQAAIANDSRCLPECPADKQRLYLSPTSSDELKDDCTVQSYITKANFVVYLKLPPSGSIRISVVGVKGSGLTRLDVMPNDKADAVKMKIADMFDIAKDRMILTFKGEEITGKSDLSSSNIVDGSRLTIERGICVHICPRNIKSACSAKVEAFHIIVSPNKTILHLKERISDQLFIAMHRLRIFSKVKAGQDLPNPNRLADYRIKEGSTLHLDIIDEQTSADDRSGETGEGGAA